MKWTDEKKKILIDAYPNHTDKELCELLGITNTQLRSIKYRLGLNGKRTLKAPDITGSYIGDLLVLGEAYKTPGSRNTRWLCKCILCGNVFSVCDYWLHHSDPSHHCPCSKSKIPKKIKHGGAGTTLYNRYNSMISRTENPNTFAYQYYGGRGIKVCEEWRHDFSAYRDWCLSHGWDESMSVDRIDNNGDYSPDNCRIIPLKDQPKNRRHCKKQYIPPEDTK